MRVRLGAEPGQFFEWLLESAIGVADLSLDDPPAMRARAARYRGRSVDVADRTLAGLAVRQKVNPIATADLNDFETCRLPNRKTFRNLIAR